MLVSRFWAQKKLSVLWFINAGILALIFLIFTILDRFDQQTGKGWEWYSQNLIPITSLMLATFLNSVNESEEDKSLNKFYFNLCYGVSIFYLALLYLTILLAPVAFSFSNMSILELFDKSKIYLAIFQGVITFTLGMFFKK